MRVNLLSVLFMTFMSIILFQGCTSDTTIKVGLCMDDYIQERWQKDRDLFVKKVEELGGKTLVESAKGDHELQLRQAQNLIKEGVKVLVIVPVNGESAAQIVEAAHSAKVQVISYDRLIKNSDLDYYVSYDNIKVGELQAEYLVKRKPVGNFAVISGPTSDNNSLLVKIGQMNVLQSYVDNGSVKVLINEFAKAWHKDEAYNIINNYFESGNESLDAIVVANDGLAEGAIEALRKRGLEGKVLVSGQDADLEAGKCIVKGIQAMTIYKPIEAIAYSAAITAMKIAKNEPVRNADRLINNGKKDVPSILLSPTVVDKDNILSTVVADGHLKEDQLYGLDK
jgi:D-xylose transport system substrate-binding protein